MPVISNNREYSTSKNIKLYFMYPAASGGEYYPDMYSAGFIPSGKQWFSFGSTNGGWNYVASSGSGNDTLMTGRQFGLARIPNLQEIPDLANGVVDADRDTIEITTLEDEYHEYADGLRNRSDDVKSVSFNFLYDGDCYNALQKVIANWKSNLDADENYIPGPSETTTPSSASGFLWHQRFYLIVLLPDGAMFIIKPKSLSLQLNGAGVAAALTFTLNCEIDGDIDYRKPAAGEALPYNLAGVVDGVNTHKVYVKYGTSAWTNDTDNSYLFY